MNLEIHTKELRRIIQQNDKVRLWGMQGGCQGGQSLAYRTPCEGLGAAVRLKFMRAGDEHSSVHVIFS